MEARISNQNNEKSRTKKKGRQNFTNKIKESSDLNDNFNSQYFTKKKALIMPLENKISEFGAFIGFCIISLSFVYFNIGFTNLGLTSLLLGAVIIIDFEIRIFYYSLFTVFVSLLGLSYDLFYLLTFSSKLESGRINQLFHLYGIFGMLIKTLNLLNVALDIRYSSKNKITLLDDLKKQSSQFKDFWGIKICSGIHLGISIVFVLLHRYILASLNIFIILLFLKDLFISEENKTLKLYSDSIHSLLMFIITIALLAYFPIMSSTFQADGNEITATSLMLFWMNVANIFELSLYSKKVFNNLIDKESPLQDELRNKEDSSGQIDTEKVNDLKSRPDSPSSVFSKSCSETPISEGTKDDNSVQQISNKASFCKLPNKFYEFDDRNNNLKVQEESDLGLHHQSNTKEYLELEPISHN